MTDFSPSHIPPAPLPAPRDPSGVHGLDAILAGGLTAGQMYLVEGTPGTGKTTLALQFLLRGRELGERGLYVTLSESAAELRAVAATHGWTLDGIEIFELVNEAGLDPDNEQSVLHPSELELGETIRGLMQKVDDVAPRRAVFDSLSEMRLLAQNPLRYRRQVLALKQFLSGRGCTVLLLDDRTSETGDLQLHSIAHGVICLEQMPREYGAERRRLRVVKMRGVSFRGGYHDLLLETGGMTVFPRLVAAEHPQIKTTEMKSTGSRELDALIGGGLSPGTNILLSGPSGAGKTTTAVYCMLAALQRGEKATYYLFDEGRATLLTRCESIGMDLKTFLASGHLHLVEVDPADLSPGEFASKVRTCVESGASSFVVIDSLNAYLQAMPGEKHLILQMHELLNYLNQQGVITLLVLAQHGIIGQVDSDVDLSYLSDSLLLFRYFEAKGQVRTAVAAVKSRTAPHERQIREFRLDSEGLRVGEALTDFQGVLAGLPSYTGEIAMLKDRAASE